MKLALFLGAAALVVGTAAAAAGDKAALEPSTPWGIDYADDQCTLYRTFGEGDGAVTLHMSQYSPGGSLKFSVGGKKIRTKDSHSLRVWLEPEETPYLDDAPTYATFGDLRGVIFTRHLSRQEDIEKLLAETRDGRDWQKAYEFFVE